MNREIWAEIGKGMTWAVCSISSAIYAFCQHTLPVIEWLAAAFAIAASFASFRATHRAHSALKKK